jgi:hypothetical protein
MRHFNAARVDGQQRDLPYRLINKDTVFPQYNQVNINDQFQQFYVQSR